MFVCDQKSYKSPLQILFVFKLLFCLDQNWIHSPSPSLWGASYLACTGRLWKEWCDPVDFRRYNYSNTTLDIPAATHQSVYLHRHTTRYIYVDTPLDISTSTHHSIYLQRNTTPLKAPIHAKQDAPYWYTVGDGIQFGSRRIDVWQ
jgi:hypothetical protein